MHRDKKEQKDKKEIQELFDDIEEKKPHLHHEEDSERHEKPHAHSKEEEE